MSAIEWTDETWNVVTGCDRVSPGCDNCYIERTPPFRMEGRRFDEHGRMGIRLHPDRLEKPLRWRKPRRVFVNSLSDLFHKDVPFDFLASVFDVMARTPQHTYQILTKRAQRMPLAVDDALGDIGNVDVMSNRPLPLPNVWLGVSVENQRYADLRIPHLLATPAAVRFLSIEPLLGPVNIEPWLDGCGPECDHDDPHDVVPSIDWVIVGGESGPGARPMHPDWVRDLRDQCTAAGVPFFFKQWGEFCHPAQLPPDVEGSGSFVDDLWRVGKKAAGRELDGRTWDEYPS